MRTSHALGAVALVLSIAACTAPTITNTADSATDTPPSTQAKAQSSAPAKPKAAGVGDVITLKGLDESLKISAKLNKVINSGTPANEIAKPDSGKRLFGVELILKNTGTAAYDDSPALSAKVVDSEGQEYEAYLFGEIAGTHKFDAVTFGSGDTRKGVIAFDVPTKAKIVKFLFALNAGFAGQKGEWLTK